MILRSLLLLGVGAAIACATPAFAAGTTTADKTETTAAKTDTVAALSTDPSKADETAVQKPKAKSATKKVKKKVAKKKKPAATEEVVEEKPKGLFATLFGGSIKEKNDKDDSKAKAKDDAKAKAKPVKVAVKPKVEESKPEDTEPVDVSFTRNPGELRSDQPDQKPAGIFSGLFGGATQVAMLPETRSLDAILKQKQAKKKFKVRPEYEPQEVEFSGYPAGTIVIDTDAKFLYLVESRSTARRYGIAVGKEGLQYKGQVTVGDKQEWPRWIPTKEMQERDPKKYGQYKDGMDGGGENPLGARAIYLYQGKKDTHLRIHGTIAPQSIGTNASNGCFRMINEHVIELYSRVKVGTPVVVL